MQRLEVSGAVRPIYELLGVKRLRGSRGKWEKLRDEELHDVHSSPDMITFIN